MRRVDVLPATSEQEPLVANLFQLYAHDFSEFSDVTIGEDGRFDYAALPLYWQETHRRAFLIRVNGALAGFVLVQRGSRVSGAADIWDVAEFFVLRGYRGQGVGVSAVSKVWRTLAGRWEVRVQQRNSAALAFWRRAVSEFTRRPADPVLIILEGKPWHVFTFGAE